MRDSDGASGGAALTRLNNCALTGLAQIIRVWFGHSRAETMTTPHLRLLEPRQGLLFELIVKRVAAENGVPLTGGTEVLQEIGFAVGAMLRGGTQVMANLSPEIDAMVEVWRKLDREAQSTKRPAWWPTEPVSMLAAC